jgi:hypothetical protein
MTEFYIVCMILHGRRQEFGGEGEPVSQGDGGQPENLLMRLHLSRVGLFLLIALEYSVYKNNF